MNLRHPIAAALAAALTLPATAAAQQSEPLSGTLPRATVVGAAGGWTAWSAYEGNRYVLVTRAPDGTVARPAVAPRRVPFDLDLGTDAAGRVVAAYSRCTTEPTLVGGANATAPNYSSGSGCRISILDLTAGTERRLPLSRGSASDVLPSVAGRGVAFIAVPKARRLRGKAQLRWRTGSGSSSKLLESGARRTGTPNISGGPANVDTDGTRIAVVWRYQDEEFNSFDSVLRVGGFASRFKQVAFGVNGESCSYDQVLAPTLTGRTVSFLETNGSTWVLERTPTSRRSLTYGVTRLGEPGVIVTSAALDGTRLVVAESAEGSGLGRATATTEVRQIQTGAFSSTSPVEYCDG